MINIQKIDFFFIFYIFGGSPELTPWGANFQNNSTTTDHVIVFQRFHWPNTRRRDFGTITPPARQSPPGGASWDRQSPPGSALWDRSRNYF